MPIAKGRSPADLAHLFPPQRSELDCLPSTIAGVVAELCERHGVKQRITQRQIDRACGYVESDGSVTDSPGIKALLDTILERQNQEAGFDFGPASTLETLKGTLADRSASFPVVGLNERYFYDVLPEVRGDPQGYAHAVILLGLSDAVATVYDPLLRAYHGDKGGEKYLADLPLVRFQKHWQAHAPANWAFWVKSRGKTTRPRTLADYEAK